MAKKVKYSDSAYAFVASVLEKFVDAMKREVDGVCSSNDCEYVHRMRVASRRMRNAFAVSKGFFPSKELSAWEKQIRRVTNTLSAARDKDVQIIRLQELYNGLSERSLKPGIHRVIVRLNQERELLQPEVIKAMKTFTKRGVLKDINNTTM